jgi:acetyl-CoA carboxylase carboxyltransferase component
MAPLQDRVDRHNDEFLANRAAMLAALAELDAELARARAGGGERYVARHRERHKLLARERIELLVDRDSPFLELSPLAASGTDYTVGASLVTGVGVVAGVECVVCASDPTVRGGSSNPYTVRKSFRAADIARENRLPLLNLVESGGATRKSSAVVRCTHARAASPTIWRRTSSTASGSGGRSSAG